MMELIDEIKESFDKAQAASDATSDQPVTVIGHDQADLPPGFLAMKTYYEQQTTVITRRGYRHFAGSKMPTDSDELVDITGEFMIPLLVSMLFRTFADGVRVGHQDDQRIKMAFHYGEVDALFESDTFVAGSSRMGIGFAEDPEILQFFYEYVAGGVKHLSHITGFAHSQVESTKVWDIWVLAGHATATAVYLAGHRLGNTWRERDVLSGIEIASEASRELE